MSDYLHNKVVRLPLPKEILSKYDDFGIDDYLKELLGELWRNTEKNSFDLTYTEGGYYIDWIYYSTYGEESGDYGFVRMLTENELNVIKPYFDKLGIEYKDDDLRVVDYCYYNACEPPDYYDIEHNKEDDVDLFIN